MRNRHAAFIVAAFVSCVASSTPAPLHATPTSAAGYDYVVALSTDAHYSLNVQLGSTAALGRNLLDGIEPGAPPPTPAYTLRLAGNAQPLPHDFDPARVWLLHAADSSAAAAAASGLVATRVAEWAEPVVMREVCDATDWIRAPRTGISTQRPAPHTGVHRPSLGVLELPGDFPDDPLFRDGRQWGLRNNGSAGGVAGADIHALAAWQRSCGAPWLRLAVLDTGIDPAHPDLGGSAPGGIRIEGGLNVTAEESRSWADSAAHGTAVAGVMAARTHDGAHFDSLGVAGVCGGDGAGNPGCRIVPIKVAPGHSTSASTFDIARGILAAVAAGARAVNLSFGGVGASRIEREAMRYAMERNCLVVAASGNRGALGPREAIYPAAYAADGLCLQVGATDAQDHRAMFSSFGPGLDIVAPGSIIWTTFLSYPSAAGAVYPGYVAVSGTSFAAPFATGVAGLLVASRPELFADDLRELIRRGARDIGAAGPDEETGAGMLDAATSLEAIAPGIGIWHDEIAATDWRDAGIDSLVVGESGPGNMSGPRTWSAARRIEARATVTVPDSFASVVAGWPRIAGTSTVRGDYRLPYFAPHAAIEWLDARTFVLKGSLYRVASGGDSLDIPLPFDQARFSFTLLGPVRKQRLAREAGPARPALAAHPNPFRGSLSINAPSATQVELFDIGGRRVHHWASDGNVSPLVWEGRDAAGNRSPPGLYWVRAHSPRGTSQLRVIKLE